MKRTRPLHLITALGALALLAPAAFAGTRCSDDPERCVKSTATLSRPVSRVVAGTAAAPTVSPTPAAPAPATLARKSTPAVRKPTAKTQRAPSRATPTPGMGMLLKLSNGSSGDISWNPGRQGGPSGQGWVL